MRIRTHKIRLYVATIALCFCPSAAIAAVVDHTFHLTLGNDTGQSVKLPAIVVPLEVEFVPVSGRNGTNPLYEAQTTTMTNPLYTPGANPGSLSGVSAITMTLAGGGGLHAEGIIHRDIATRNMIFHTDHGTYETDVQDVIHFGNDGPPELRGIGPVRWMSPESIRSKHYTPNAPVFGDATLPQEHWYEIQAFSFFDATYVPEPGSVVLLTLAGMAALRRRLRS